jgi:excinuclease ABC subunit C
MLDAAGKILYIGKAKNLRKRLASYCNKTNQQVKTLAMLQQVSTIEVSLTTNELAAYVLEQKLIKRHKPRYNVALRDGKSYPYLCLERDIPHYARLYYYRDNLETSKKNSKQQLFGPYPHLQDLRFTLDAVQQLFKLRNCSPSMFKSRTRPCLQYQIQRCSAPCVGLINEEHYQLDTKHALCFLRGNTKATLNYLQRAMQTAAAQQEYAWAAHLRDQIASLRHLQQAQKGMLQTEELTWLVVTQNSGQPY